MSLPERFRRPIVLIVGCGDVGLRVVRALPRRVRVLALTSSRERLAQLRAAGITPLHGDLDEPATLARLAGLADAVLHLAPTSPTGSGDERTANLLAALARKRRERCIVYVSTSGVYGNADGARFDETRAVAPATDRACRRVEAESRLRWYGRAFGVRVSVLRVPGIYALDREGGDPRQRVARGSPVLARDDDVYTNHIHADDLARACIAALWRGARQRVYHVSDDGESRMGDHFDRVADLSKLPRPPRITREQAARQLTPLQMSFLGESRRLDNGRLKRELRLRLRYRTIDDALEAAAPAAVAGRQAGW